MKYERRKYFREYRKAGIPFMAAHRLAKLKARGSFACEVAEELQKEGITVETLTFCECCGPEVLRLRKGEKFYDLRYFGLMPYDSPRR